MSSLFGSIQMAGNALRATQIGLQVVGQNIANANTADYIREEVNFVPAPTQRAGSILLGMGVRVSSVVQKIDNFLEDRLRSARSDVANSEVQEHVFQQLEGLVGELGDTDLSTSLSNFMAAISEVLNQPESISVRNLAMLKGETLAGDIGHLSNRVRIIRSDVNDRLVAAGDEINQLVDEIVRLNQRITQAEGGDVSFSDAVGLRDQRLAALTSLARLVDIRVEEQPSGGVAVFAAGDFLVFEGQARHVEVANEADRGLTIGRLRMSDTDAPLLVGSGEVAGLYAARDEILAGFLDNLDDFARTLAFEFNRIYSSGQGLAGYDELYSEFAVVDPDAALNQAGLSYTPENGSFEIQVYNRRTGLTQTTSIDVDLNGFGHDTTLNDLVAQLAAVSGVAASITQTGQLELASTADDQEIAFGNDTSGILAALGINTFFSGASALSLGVNDYIRDDPAKLAASRGGIGEDTANAVDLAGFLDRPLDSHSGATIGDVYTRMMAETTQGSAVARSVAEGFRAFEGTLDGQHLATSGVSIDEEAIKMLSYQRTYQAAAKYIATLDELLQILVSI
jgi:flagellar hook-associated protein 1 FlgK